MRAARAARCHSYLLQLQLIPSRPQRYWQRFRIEQSWQVAFLWVRMRVCFCVCAYVRAGGVSKKQAACKQECKNDFLMI
jgi:hypothetical protein